MSTQQPDRAFSRSFVQAVVLFCAILSPWAYGAAHPISQRWLASGIGLAAVAWAVLLVRNRLANPIAVGSTLCLLALTTIPIFQVVPWPVGTVDLVSPSKAKAIQKLLPADREVVDGQAAELTAWSATNCISYYPAATWSSATWLFLLLVLFVVVQTTCTKDSLWWLMVFATINGTLLATFAFIQAGSSQPGEIYWSYQSIGNAFGPFVNRNHFAFYINACFCCGVGLFGWRFYSLKMKERATPARPLKRASLKAGSKDVRYTSDPVLLCLSLALIVMLASLFRCESRGGLLSLSVALFWLGWRQKIKIPSTHFVLFGIAIFGLAVSLAIWMGFRANESRILELAMGNAPVDDRIQLWQRSSQLFFEHWLLGTGFGTTRFVEPMTRTNHSVFYIDFLHNDYLQQLLETGLVGFLPMIGLFYFAGRRAHQPTESSHSKLLLDGVVAAVVAMAAHSFLDFGMRIPACACMATIMIANLIGIPRARQIHRGRRVSPSAFSKVPDCAPRYSAVFIGAILCFTSVLVTVGIRSMRKLDLANREWRNAQQQFQQDDLKAYRKAIQAALGITPHRAEWQVAAAEAIAVNATPNAAPLSLEEQKQLQLHLVKARDLCPTLAIAQANLARAAHTYERADDVQEYFQRALIGAPTSPALLFVVGSDHYSRNDIDAACRFWRNSLRQSPDYAEQILRSLCAVRPTLSIQQIASVFKGYPKATERATKFLACAPKNLAIDNADALRLELLLDAIAALEEKNNLSAQDIYLRAQLKSNAGELSSAIEDYRFAVFLNPNEDSWRYNLAVALNESQQYDAARAELRRVVRRGRHEPSSKLLLQLLKTN